ncbi:hypothetical protein [Pseudonocardia sp.]|uniref:hypothetical protein n=1 Tax=Pseudonocardia sp. TaxID=60912 RepID=UPI003D0DB617
MNSVEQLIRNFQELVAQVPEIVQPFIVMLAGAIPFIEGEVGAVIGVVGGLHPVVAAVAAGAGNLLCVLLVVVVAARARAAVVDRRPSVVALRGGAGPGPDENDEESAVTAPVSKRRQRFTRLLVRFGVPGASIIGPLLIPTQIMAAILVGSGTPPRWVLLWQTVAIVIWTTIATVSAWAALTFLVGVS